MKATELPSYWATSMKLIHHNCRAERVKSRKIPMKKIFARKKSYQATKLLSYRQHVWRHQSNEVTKLPSYWATGMEKFSGFFFREVNKATKLPTYRRNGKKISAEKKATKLPSYWATGSMSGVISQTKLPSYRATGLPIWKNFPDFFFREVNKATKIPTYRRNEKKNFRRKKSYQATYLLSYWQYV